MYRCTWCNKIAADDDELVDMIDRCQVGRDCEGRVVVHIVPTVPGSGAVVPPYHMRQPTPAR